MDEEKGVAQLSKKRVSRRRLCVGAVYREALHEKEVHWPRLPVARHPQGGGATKTMSKQEADSMAASGIALAQG